MDDRRQIAIDAAEKATQTWADLQTAYILGWLVPGIGIDPFLFALLMGWIHSEADAHEAEKMRAWTLDQWVPRVRDYLREASEAGPEPEAPPFRPDLSADAEPAPDPVAVRRDILARPPLPPVEAPEQAPGEAPAGPVRLRVIPPGQLPPPPPTVPPGAPPPPPSAPGLPPPPSQAAPFVNYPIPAPPPGMPESLRDAWIQARTRAGDLARGLGNYLDGKAGAIMAEVWNGAEIDLEADPELRQQRLAMIREATARSLAEGWTPERLASEFGNLSQDWSRNWDRIARTELQFAHSEGSALSAIRTYGMGATLAVIPNAGACEACRRLYLDADGSPNVFNVAQLAGNRTNAGRKQAAWLPTLPPLHPNCRCNVQVVPPGMDIDEDGRLVRA